MSYMLAGKGAVVTGGSRGIGRAVVQRLAADGATVVFNFARSVDQAVEVEKAVRDAGGRAHAVQIDLATPGAVSELMTYADQHLDGLDILINNAAFMGSAFTSITDTSEELYDTIMAVNTKSTFLTMRHAARIMRDNGRIINMSTIGTTQPAPGVAPYIASKGAIEQFTKVAAIELGSRGITVNAVCPGATDTEPLRKIPEAVLEQIAKLTPLGRLGQPHDIANVVAILAGHDGHWITGQIICVTGGFAPRLHIT